MKVWDFEPSLKKDPDQIYFNSLPHYVYQLFRIPKGKVEKKFLLE